MKKYSHNNISIDSDDDNENYELFDSFLQENTESIKKSLISDIEENGNYYLKEIEKRKIHENKEKNILINKIMKYRTNKYDENELYQLSLNDVRNIYDEMRKNNRSFFSKFFYFIFNFE